LTKKSRSPKQNRMTIADTLTKKDKAKILAVGKGVVDRKKKKPKTKQDSELKKIRGRLARKEITKAEYEKLKLKILKKKFQTTKNSKQQPKTTNKHLHTRGKICPKCGSKTKKYGTNISCTNPKCNWFKN
ncbi:MAG: hypothetical protein VYC15_05200, partial [Pseudomonadota bacterium]|nr:hypothetical protein [Pseudomonadota bacterium]